MMSLRLLILRSLAHRRRPVAVALAAVGIAATLLAAFLALRLDIRAGLERELAVFGPNLVMTSETGLPEAGIPEVPEPVARFGYRVAQVGKTALIAVSAEPEAVRALHPFWRVEGSWPERGEAMLGSRAAARLGISPGGSVDLAFPGAGLAPVRLRVSGLLSTGGSEEGQILAASDDLPPVPFTVAVARVPGSLADVEARAERLSAAGLQARPIRRVAGGDERLLGRVEALLGWLGSAILATCLLCAGTQLASLAWQRRTEVALMRALGASPRQVARQLLGEAVVLGLAGGVLGSALGAALAAWMARSMFGVDLHLRLPVVPIVLGAAVLLALAAQGLPVRLALRAEPAILLRGD